MRRSAEVWHIPASTQGRPGGRPAGGRVMKRAAFRLLPVAALAAFAVAGSALSPQSASSNSPIGNKILAHKLAVELGTEKARGKEMPVSSGIMYTLYDAAGVLQRRAAQNPGAMRALGGGNHGISSPKTEGCQNVFHGHGMTNTRVNQDCSFRRQAEETIQINPTNEKNIIAGQNDSQDRLQPLRLRLELRRRQALGRPGSALLAVRPARRPHGGCVQRSDAGLGLAGQRVCRRRVLRHQQRRQRRARR